MPGDVTYSTQGLAYIDVGVGEPVVLIHGIGMSSFAWTPVIPMLSQERRVIAVDLPGFGDSARLLTGQSMPGMLTEIRALLQELGIAGPVDFVGNSLGGCLALEAAKHGLAKRVIALSPAGLWKGRCPLRTELLLKGLFHACHIWATPIKRFMSYGFFREIALMFPVTPGGRRVASRDAAQMIEDVARSSAFSETFRVLTEFLGGKDISVPLSVVFGGRDLLLSNNARCRDMLPAHTRWIDRPGWGHVPMWTDPDGVGALLLGELSS